MTPAKVAIRQEERDTMNFSFTTDDPQDIYSHSLNKVYNLKKSPQEYYGDRLIKDYADDFSW